MIHIWISRLVKTCGEWRNARVLGMHGWIKNGQELYSKKMPPTFELPSEWKSFDKNRKKCGEILSTFRPVNKRSSHAVVPKYTKFEILQGFTFRIWQQTQPNLTDQKFFTIERIIKRKLYPIEYRHQAQIHHAILYSTCSAKGVCGLQWTELFVPFELSNHAVLPFLQKLISLPL